MADFEERRLPVGIQSFKEIRRNNYAYVDKTEIVWNLVNRGKKYNYLLTLTMRHPSWIFLFFGGRIVTFAPV